MDTDLWDWHQDVNTGTFERKTVSIILMDDAGDEAWRWVCVDAFPAKLSGAELDATGNAVSTESIELVHQGMSRQ